MARTSRLRRAGWAVLYAAALLLVPLVFGTLRGLSALHAAFAVEPAPLPERLPAPPARDGRPVAALLVSNAGTEITDLLAPYAVLAASGAFQVVTVAPERVSSPLTGGVSLLPHHSFASFAREFPDGAALVVVPFLFDPLDPELLAWLRAAGAEPAHVLSICEGARTVAAAGMFDGRRATSHFFALDGLEKEHPEASWQRDVRWVSDGRIASSAGVTAAIDATFAVLADLAGDDAAVRTARSLGHTLRAAGEPAPGFRAGDLALAWLNGGYLLRRESLAVSLAPGVDELALAALLDVLPRSMHARTVTVAAEPIVRSAHGMDLLAAQPLEQSASADGLLAPRAAAPAPAGEAFAPAALDGVFPAAFARLAQRSNAPTARFVAKMIQFPEARLALPADAAGWPVALALRPLALGLLGLATVRVLRRRTRTEPAP